jgi:hypothetical protein
MSDGARRSVAPLLIWSVGRGVADAVTAAAELCSGEPFNLQNEGDFGSTLATS